METISHTEGNARGFSIENHQTYPLCGVVSENRKTKMKKTQPKFKLGQSVKLLNRPTRNAKIENVVGFFRGSWLYQVSYQVFDEITPKGSKRYSQPFNEDELKPSK